MSRRFRTDVPPKAYKQIISIFKGFPNGSAGKETACNAGDTGNRRFDPLVRKIPWRKKWQATLVFFPEISHGQRRLAGYNPKGHRESDTTE